MKLRIDRKADALYLRLDDSKVIESEEVAPGVIVDFDSRNKVVGVEVLDVSERSSRRQGGKRSSMSIPTPAVVREKPSKKFGK
jgi:uncharacterized protein YuzE